MKTTIGNLILLLIFFNSLFVISQEHQATFQEGELLIQIDQKADIDRIVSDYYSFGLSIKHTVSERFSIYLLEFNPSIASNPAMIAAIEADPLVLNVQNNHRISLRKLTDTVPNDSLFQEQWSMDNYGQNGGNSDADIDATNAWEINTGGLTADGDTIVVAIVDGGSDIFHEDLDHWVNYHEIPGNGIDDDSNGYIDDLYGWNAFDHNGNIPFHQHGTHVGGIVGAKGNNSIGVAGVNWNLKILPVAGGSTQEATVVEALSYIYVVREQYDQSDGQKGAFVVADNCSFGVNEGQPEDYPIWEAMYDSLGQLGILSIGATANRNWDIDEVGDIPTAFETPHLISVTNTTNKDIKSTNAGYGDTTIDLGAPGTIIQSTLVNNKYGNKTGTSMAAPHVAGAVALLMSSADSTFISAYKNNPAETILEIKEHIINGVDTIGDLIGKTVSGGRLNVYNAINLLLDAPSLSLNLDSLYTEVLINSEAYENLILSNAGGDTIFYSIEVQDNPDWLQLSQYNGTLPSLENNEIGLTFNTTGLDTGTYTTTLEISGNDIPTRFFPITMHVYDNVGVNNYIENNSGFDVFPNPFNSVLNITTQAIHSDQYTIEIYDQYGKLRLSKILKKTNSSQSVELGFLIEGLYYYRIIADDTVMFSGKLLKY